MPRPQRIPTGRTWRDLPPSPPSTFVPAPVVPEDPEIVERPRAKVWPFVVGGLVVIAVGFVVGLLLPDDGAAEDATLDATSSTTLPDIIIPPPPTSIAPESAPFSIPPLGNAPAVDELFAVPRPPDGFQISANMTRSSSERIDQNVVLTDGVLEVEVTAHASAVEPTLPVGEAVEVRGQEGVITRTEDGRFVISWIEPGKVSFSVDAPDEFGTENALRLAESLEMR